LSHRENERKRQLGRVKKREREKDRNIERRKEKGLQGGRGRKREI
jgi:hypothetical protein